MAKFNITVDLDFIDDEYNIDNEIQERIINTVVGKVKDSVITNVETESAKRINEQMASIEKAVGEKLNSIMDNFFDEPRNVTDNYGVVVKKGVTVKQTLRDACDNFLNQPVDKDGKPVKDSWSYTYKTRVDYFVAKAIDYPIQRSIEKAVDEIKKNLQQKITTEVKTQLGDKVAEILELNKILKV